MVSEKHLYDAHDHIPIPSYEEATSSRPSSQNSRLGPEEVSDDAERQGLLGRELSSAQQSTSGRRNGGYQPPSVQSVHSDDDSDYELGSLTSDTEHVALRQEMEEMDILDPESAEDGQSRRNRMRDGFSKRFYRITNSFSGLHLPKLRWPSFGWLTSRIPSIPERYRPGWAVIARLAGLMLIISLAYILVVSEIMPVGGAGGFGQPFNAEWVRTFAQENVDSGLIEDNLRYITSYDHVAGTEGSYFLAQWIEQKFQASHMDGFAHEEYYAYLNYPKPGKEGRRVAIVDPPELAWEAKLEEESVSNPPKQQTASFHGLSASGNVTGPLIYVNYGTKEDFDRLTHMGIDVKGAIVLVRNYGPQSERAMKVKLAEDGGAVGVLIYSDPADDGFVKGEPWPKGRWVPEDGVQRGSVALTNKIVGDVLTPGYPSNKDAIRISKNQNPGLVGIPSLPLAWRDAQKLLQALKGHGQKASDDWRGGAPLWPAGEANEWWTGDARSPKVNLQNLLDEVDKQRVYNTFGAFEGFEEKAKKIIVGNHRDSWCFGAADPGSGTAIMVEVARVLGELRAAGWRPLRSIQFSSWDAGEYNMIGSTEFVEANIDELRANALAYINVDVGVTGGDFHATGSPLFTTALSRVLGRIQDPQKAKTLRELWDQASKKIGKPGARMDSVAFQDLAGCASIDIGFSGPEHGFPYHSCYDTFDWMQNYGDTGFVYHKLLAQVWVLLILELAQEPILPLDTASYVDFVKEQVQELESWASKKGMKTDGDVFAPLRQAAQSFDERASNFRAWEDVWYSQFYGAGGESTFLTNRRIQHNMRMSHLDMHLLDLPRDKKDTGPHGVPGREQYKHIIFGPDASGSAFDAAIFPFIRDAIEAQDWDLARAQIQKTADILNNATDHLLH